MVNIRDIAFSQEGSVKLAKRFIRKCPKDDIYIDRLAFELEMINRKNFVEHFLIACDILDLTTDIPHITRGSCGSSLVSYLLGISTIDPVKEYISFSRFINEHRTTMPDIDFDFPHNKRDIVFDRIHQKWQNNVARISNHIMYKEKSALRAAIKDQGYNKFIPKHKLSPNIIPEKKDAILKKQKELLGKFRQYSLHCGGIIFYTDGIPESITLQRTQNQKEQPLKQVKYNKIDVEKHEKLKVDILSNRGLSQLFEISNMPLDNYPTKDQPTEQLLSKANNIGLTFAESPIMKKTIAAIKPKSIKELAICLAIIRPAAASSGKKTNYLKNGTIDNYTNYIIFDDDAIDYIKNILNCNSGDADKYRRSFAKRKYQDMLYFEAVISDMDEKDDIMDNLDSLHKYSFCKSHSYSYAQLVWALAYQKANNPKQFWVSTLNNCSSMYRSWVHFSEAKTSGIELTLGRKPWKLVNNKLISRSKDSNKNKQLPTDPIEQYKLFGYWTSPDFLPNMYVKIIDKKENIVEFRGLIATGRIYYDRFTKYKNKNNSKIKTTNSNGCTFITIGYKTGYLIDITIYDTHKFGHYDVVKGKGYVKNYIDGIDYLSIDVFEHKFEKL